MRSDSCTGITYFANARRSFRFTPVGLGIGQRGLIGDPDLKKLL